MADLKETILSVQDLATQTEDVPEWGGVRVELRELTGPQRKTYFETIKRDEKGLGNVIEMHAAAIALGARDPETGELVFTLEDVPAIMEKKPDVVDRLGRIVLRLSGLGVKVEEDTEKKSDSDTPK